MVENTVTPPNRILIVNMSRSQTNILKGVAILLMIFLHLFMRVGESYKGLCQPLIYIGNEPLVHILTNASNPVAFFLIFSGYGLSYSSFHKKYGIRKQFLRILKLYVTYWIVCIIFVGIGNFVQPSHYPGTWKDIVLNITAVSCTWNYEIWFLFPYVMLAMSSMLIFHVMDKIGDIFSVVLSFILMLACGYVISKSVSSGTDLGALSILLVYLELLFPFILGVWLHHRTEMHRPIFKTTSLKAALLLCLLIVVECNLPTDADDSVYAFVFVLLFLNFSLPGHIQRILAYLGKYSMPMWLVHTYFCTYLFPDFIYGFRYPILIFIVLCLISLAVAILISRVSLFVNSKLMV
ncbi:MAG: acyltransferase [Prevotella sp.]|nr:acyltransferase [Prevotella sp.]